MYRVYYMNQFIKAFPERDNALAFVLRDMFEKSRAYDDYEILDRSDYL